MSVQEYNHIRLERSIAYFIRLLIAVTAGPAFVFMCVALLMIAVEVFAKAIIFIMLVI